MWIHNNIVLFNNIAGKVIHVRQCRSQEAVKVRFASVIFMVMLLALVATAAFAQMYQSPTLVQPTQVCPSAVQCPAPLQPTCGVQCPEPCPSACPQPQAIAPAAQCPCPAAVGAGPCLIAPAPAPVSTCDVCGRGFQPNTSYIY